MERDPLPQLDRPGLGPTPPAPFGEGPRDLRPGGCGRLALIGCGLGMLLIGVAAVIAVLRVHEVLAWTLSLLETQVEQRLPPEVDEATRERLGRAFAGARQAIRSGELDPAALEGLQRQLMQLAAPAEGPLSAAEVDSLIEVLEEVAAPSAGEPEGPGAEPSRPAGEATVARFVAAAPGLA